LLAAFTNRIASFELVTFPGARRIGDFVLGVTAHPSPGSPRVAERPRAESPRTTWSFT